MYRPCLDVATRARLHAEEVCLLALAVRGVDKRATEKQRLVRLACGAFGVHVLAVVT
jgi:hypothetical protein